MSDDIVCDALVFVAFCARFFFLARHAEFLRARAEFLNVTVWYWGGPPRSGTSLLRLLHPAWMVDHQHLHRCKVHMRVSLCRGHQKSLQAWLLDLTFA